MANEKDGQGQGTKKLVWLRVLRCMAIAIFSGIGAVVFLGIVLGGGAALSSFVFWICLHSIVAVLFAVQLKLKAWVKTYITDHPWLGICIKYIGEPIGLGGCMILLVFMSSFIDEGYTSYKILVFYTLCYIDTVCIVQLFGHANLFGIPDGIMVLMITEFFRLEPKKWYGWVAFFVVVFLLNILRLRFRIYKKEKGNGNGGGEDMQA